MFEDEAAMFEDDESVDYTHSEYCTVHPDYAFLYADDE